MCSAFLIVKPPQKATEWIYEQKVKTVTVRHSAGIVQTKTMGRLCAPVLMFDVNGGSTALKTHNRIYCAQEKDIVSYGYWGMLAITFFLMD